MGADQGRVRTTKSVGKAPAPQRRFSQNYLTDQTIAKKIVDAVPIQENDIVIEIGPGPGALTQWLQRKKCKRVIAVDVDERSLHHLREQSWFDPNTITLLHSDILKVQAAEQRDAFKAQQCHVIGNIPYAITSDILFWMIDQRRTISSAVITMQREVARRCVAQPGSKDYGILSVACWFASQSKLLFHIQPGSFFPKPEVTSSVVLFNFRDADPFDGSFDGFMQFVRAAFGQRRKVMSNALRSWSSLIPGDPLNNNHLHAGHDLSRIRSETLTPEQLVAVYVSLTSSTSAHE